MHCPACGASNPEGSRWCGQCLTTFESAPEPRASTVEAPVPQAPAVPLPQAAVEQPAAPAAAPSSGFALPQSPTQPDSAGAAVSSTGSIRGDHVAGGISGAAGFAVPTGSSPLPPPDGIGVPESVVSAEAAPAVEDAQRYLPAAGAPDTQTGLAGFAPSHQIPAQPVVQSDAEAGASSVATANRAGITKDATGRLLWHCTSCGGMNNIEEIDCTVCGASMFADYVREEQSKKRMASSPEAAAAWGLIPGAGQWMTGHAGEAIARGLLIIWLLICAIVLNDKSIAWVRLVFAGAAIVVWAISAYDARVQAGGSGPLILNTKRILLVLVFSVALLLALSFTLAKKVGELDKQNPNRSPPATEQPGPDGGGGGGDGAPT